MQWARKGQVSWLTHPLLLPPVLALPTGTMFQTASRVIGTRSSGNLVFATVVGP